MKGCLGLGLDTHAYEEIYSRLGEMDTVEVVRWCTVCGAVVVDIDYDGRTKPGAIMPLRLPTGALAIKGD